MSTAQGAVGGSNGAQEFGARDWAGGSWRGRSCGASRWTLFEIVAMVLGFIVFWPIGLAILAFKFWQRKAGYPGDLQTAATQKWREARSAMSGCDWQARRGFYAGSTGNLAFDEWKAAELARLEEERRKLQEASSGIFGVRRKYSSREGPRGIRTLHE